MPCTHRVFGRLPVSFFVLAATLPLSFGTLCAGEEPASWFSHPPALSVVGGAGWAQPHGRGANVGGGSGHRLGLSISGGLAAGELVLPVEAGALVRTMDIRFDDAFGRIEFIDLQFPLLFHGAPFGRRMPEIMAAWVPGYTLDAVSREPGGGTLPYTEALRTRFNMGFGGGAQASLAGFRFRALWVRHIFAPFPASDLTFSEWIVEASVPLLRRRGTP